MGYALVKALDKEIDQNALAEVAVDIGISPASITSLRWNLKDLEQYGFQHDSDLEELEGQNNE